MESTNWTYRHVRVCWHRRPFSTEYLSRVRVSLPPSGGPCAHCYRGCLGRHWNVAVCWRRDRCLCRRPDGVVLYLKYSNVIVSKQFSINDFRICIWKPVFVLHFFVIWNRYGLPPFFYATWPNHITVKKKTAREVRGNLWKVLNSFRLCIRVQCTWIIFGVYVCASLYDHLYDPDVACFYSFCENGFR